MQDVGGGGDEIAAVGDDHRVVARRVLERAEERDRVHVLARQAAACASISASRSASRVASVAIQSGRRSPCALLRGERDEEAAGVADRLDVGRAVHPRVLACCGWPR